MRSRNILSMALLFIGLPPMTFAQTVAMPPIVVTPSVTAGISVQAGVTTIPSVSQLKLRTLSTSELQATLPGPNGSGRIYTTSSVNVQSGGNKSLSLKPSSTSTDRVVMRLRNDLPTIIVVPCDGKHVNHEECSEHIHAHAHPHHVESYCDYDEHETDPRCKGVDRSKPIRN
jgi:hypothetical protein